MTTYGSPLRMYIRTLRELLNSQPDEKAVLAEIDILEKEANEERDAAAKPGFFPPYVSYVPAHGMEEEISARRDYCSLKKLTDERELLRVVLLHLFNESHL